MLRFFRRYFAKTAFVLVFWLSGGGLLAAADGQLYILNYEDAAVSPRARVISLSEKLKRLARQCAPALKNSRTRGVFIQLSDGRKLKPFTCRLDRRGDLRIILPDSYSVLLSEPAAFPRLTGWILFGRLGKPAELEKYFRNSWFVVGIARKAMEEMTPNRSPFAGYFPAAYTLTSADRYPSLDSLLAVPLTSEDTTLRLVYEEYCELLVLICARNGLFKSGLLTRLLDELEKSPRRTDMPELFRNLARPVLEKKAPKLFRPGLDRAGLTAAYEQWFRQELDQLLNWNFLPAAAEKIEVRYLESVRFEGKLKKSGDSKEPEKIICGGLAELVRHYQHLEAAAGIFSGMISKLTRLTRQVPPDLKIPLEKVCSTLRRFAADPSPPNGGKLLKAEQNFYHALEKNLVLENFLSETERDCTSPAARYHLTFQLIGYRDRRSMQPLQSLAALLEKTEKELEQ